MIKHLIFDLDNTIYPETSEMSKGIGSRILNYAARFYKLDVEEARRVRRDAFKIYGTTLEWMKAGGFTDVEDYFAYVHPETEINELTFDPELRGLLESIKLPKIILTNAPKEHAEHVLEFLKIRDLFNDTIVDIRMNGFVGKPAGHAFENALKIIGGSVEDTLFIDDIYGYIRGYAKMGGTSALIGKGKMEEEEVFPGITYRIKDLYALPELIEKLNKM